MLEIIDHGNIRELNLARPPANALNQKLVWELTRSLWEAGENSSTVVVSGRSGLFSGGFDIPEMIEYDRDQVSRFWQSFLNLLKTIAHMPVPVAFAMNGHAPAGGIVMALFADYRIMPGGGFKTGLNEVQVGLVVPPAIFHALARCVGAHTAGRMLVAGEIVDSDKAHAIGLVDELVNQPDEVVPRAIEWCEQHIALPGLAMRSMREMTRADLQALFSDSSELGVETFVNTWFSGSTQKTLEALVQRLQNK